MSQIQLYNVTPSGLVPAVVLKDSRYKKVITKEDFDYYYLEKSFSRDQFAEIGVGTKVFQNSFHLHYPDRAERVKMFGQRISLSQKMVNSNFKNAGKPRKLLDKERLEALVGKGMLLFDLAKEFNCSEPTVSRNLEYYQILPFKTRLVQGGTIARLKVLERLTGHSVIDLFDKGPQEVDMEALALFVERAESDLRACKEAIAKLKHNYKMGASIISRYEWFVKYALDDLGIAYKPQYSIGQYRYDFFLPEHNTLVEVDGEGHNYESDFQKEQLAEQKGFTLMRLDCSTLKNKRLCLQHIESQLSKKLESTKFTI